MSHKKKFLNEPERNRIWARKNLQLSQKKIVIEPEEKLYMSRKEIVHEPVKNSNWARKIIVNEPGKKISKSHNKLHFASSKHPGKHQEPVYNTFLKLILDLGLWICMSRCMSRLHSQWAASAPLLAPLSGLRLITSPLKYTRFWLTACPIRFSRIISDPLYYI